MAEVTAMRNNALPYPVYGVPWTLVFPILDADGDPVSSAAGLDSEISKNGDTPADCTQEATEIGSSGQYSLTLTGTEMTGDLLSGVTKTSTSGAKTTSWVLYPRKLVALRSGTAQGGDTGYITLDASAGAFNDTWNGCLCVAVIDGNTEARIIDDYDGSNQRASVTPDWNVAPDSDDTFTIYLPEGMAYPWANVLAWKNAAAPENTGDAYAVVSHVTSGNAALKTLIDAIDDYIDTEVAAIKAKTDLIPASPSSLTAQQVWEYATRVLTAGTNISLAKGTGVTGFTDLDAAGIRTAIGLATANMDTQLSGIAALVAAAAIRSALGLASANLDTQLGDIPTVAEFNARSTADPATATNQAAIAGYIDTEVAAIKAKTDLIPASPSSLTAQQVWEYATRVLTAGTNISLAKGTGVIGFNDLDAAGIRTALGLATANMDTQLSGISSLVAAAAIRSALGLASANLDTQIDAIPTAAEIKTAIEAAGSHLALIKAVTDALTSAAAAKLAASAGTIVQGTVSHNNTPATTTVFYCDDITEATADHFNGRIVIFTSGALQYQASDITDYALEAGEGKFTVTALTEAPADDVTFIIV